jgi:hypothetical protein
MLQSASTSFLIYGTSSGEKHAYLALRERVQYQYEKMMPLVNVIFLTSIMLRFRVETLSNGRGFQEGLTILSKMQVSLR